MENRTCSVYILLPMCTEFKRDIFFNVLKNVVSKVGRTKLIENHLDDAFKIAMESTCVEVNNISTNWKDFTNETDLISQSKMLGYWATTNCPRFGRVFLGDTWECPKNNFVQCMTKNGSKILHSEDINDIVFPKMKCRLIGLEVSKSTLANLKNFLHVPIDEINIKNELRISPKMLSLDIETDSMEKCWHALRNGKWLESDNYQMEPTSSQSVLSERARMDSGYVNYIHGSLHDGDTSLSLVEASSHGSDLLSVDDAPMNLSTKAGPSTQELQPKTGPSTQELQPKTGQTTQELQERVQVLESQLLAEVRKSVVALEREVSQKNELLVEIEKTKRDLQLELNQKNESFNEIQKSVVALQLELSRNIVSLVETEKFNRALQLQLSQHNESLVKIEALESELNLKNELIAGMKKPIDVLESEFIRINSLLTKTDESNRDLQLQLTEKCASLSDAEKTIAALQSKLQQKNASLVDFEKSNRDLQLQLNEKNKLLAENQKSIDEVELQFKRKSDSLAEIERTHQALQLELNQRNVTLAEAQKSVVTLQSELGQFGNSNYALQLELNEKNKLLAENQKSIDEVELQLKRKSDSLAEIERTHQALQLELNQRNVTLAEAQKSVVTLQSELGQFGNSNYALQLELDRKNESLTAMEQMKTAIHKSIVTLESELSKKNSSLAEYEKSHQAVQLELGQKNKTLAEVRKSVVALQSKLGQVENSNYALQLDLNRKNESLTVMEELKNKIHQSIVTLESELKKKNETLADVQKSVIALQSELSQKNQMLAEFGKLNHDLQLEMSRKNGSLTETEEIVGSSMELSKEEETGATIDRVESICDSRVTSRPKRRNTQKLNYGQSLKKFKGQRNRPPLYKLDFFVIGKLNRSKGEIKTAIEELGGRLVSSIHKKIAAVISTEEEVVKMSVNMSKAKRLGIQVVPLQFLEDVKTSNAIKYIKSQSICDWGLDPSLRISQKETRVKPKIEKKTTDKHKSELLPAVQELMKLLFDLDTMKKVMIEFGLDVETMPLCQLSRKNLYEALKILQKLSDLIKNCGTNADFIGYSNQFYTLLPHDFGIERASIIDTIDTINVKTEMIESLMELEVAYSFLQTETDDQKSPLDGHYEQLNTILKPIAKDTKEYALLENYVRNTHAEAHANFELKIEDIFSVERHGEQRRYEPLKKLHNRKLLWHGSRLTNYAGILSHGLKIAPPEAPPTGYMFGKGVYFTDMVSKSASYCHTSKEKNTGIVLLCEVALGDMYELTTADYITDLPKGKQSTKGSGKTFPNPDESHVDSEGVEIPCGKPITDTKLESTLLYNEYIVYDVGQINVKYLFQLNFNHKY